MLDSHSDINSEPTSPSMSSPSTSSSIAPQGWLDDRMLNAVLHDQREMLAKLEKANETLDTCNTLSHQRIDSYATDFKQHVKLLVEMKKDLESLYRRLRIVQTKVSKLYPADYADAVSKAEMNESEEDETG